MPKPRIILKKGRLSSKVEKEYEGDLFFDLDIPIYELDFGEDAIIEMVDFEFEDLFNVEIPIGFEDTVAEATSESRICQILSAEDRIRVKCGKHNDNSIDFILSPKENKLVYTRYEKIDPDINIFEQDMIEYRKLLKLAIDNWKELMIGK